MKKVDFSKVNVEVLIGEEREIDLRKTVGNTIFQNTSDIGLSDFARRVYYAEGPVEVPVGYAPQIVKIITASPGIMASAKQAITALMNEATEVEPSKK